MNPLAKLEQLNLEPTAKTEVAALIQSLIEQAERDAKTIQAKDVAINANPEARPLRILVLPQRAVSTR
ncbi:MULTISPECIES: hypothetical protein [Methylomonas]|uniref:Uncharacterized protein n=2 Tax=Methylomonas TaxID=416 RepID=A0A126T391_9GAMM|nr:MULTISPECIES: hypothetical protein [Methylomonas]AMK76538.1 hypothetical protein JT25_008545 [Methylomonas denitrificans]OAI08131.1 hypothetical protein A1342_19690 [Methylomonas methanica]